MHAVDCTIEGIAFRALVSNDWERNRIATLEGKEPETIRWILEHFRRPGDLLFDIGANVGLYALLAAVHHPGGTVVAVEPMAETFAHLCRNTQLNGLRNLRPYCIAIGAENGLATLNLSSLDAASSMHAVGEPGPFGEPVVFRSGIGVATLDALAREAGVPALIKIDVDGYEDAVLAGAAEVLRDPRLRSILIEFNWTEESPPKELRDEPLRRAGFVPTELGIEYEHGAVRWQNTIYVR